jgi:hypothetical protein
VNAAASTTGQGPDALPDCGAFEDDFTTSVAWSTDFAEVSGGRADTMPGEWGWYEENDSYGGELLSRDVFALNDCFLSVRIQAAALEGQTLFAIEDDDSRGRAFEIEIDHPHEGAAPARGVRFIVYSPTGEEYPSPFARLENVAHVGLWIDDASDLLRAYAREATGTWVLLGTLPIPPYAGAARFNMASYGWTESMSSLGAVFDDLNVLPVTRTELEMAASPVPISQAPRETLDDE